MLKFVTAFTTLGLLGVTALEAAAAHADIKAIVLIGDQAPDGNGTISKIDELTLNNKGEIAFKGTLANTSGGIADNLAIFRSDSNGALVTIARKGQPAPDGNGNFSSFGSPAFNDKGQVAFSSFLKGTFEDVIPDSGIFRGDSSDSLVQLARRGQATPDHSGTFSGVGSPALNNHGQIVFNGAVTNQTPSTGMFLGDSPNNFAQIARIGEPLPDNKGWLAGYINSPAINDMGQVAFVRAVSDTNGIYGYGLFRYDNGTHLTQVAIANFFAQRGDGTFAAVSLKPVINNSGEIAFIGYQAGALNDQPDNSGIFLSDGHGSPVPIALVGQHTPNGQDKFESFHEHFSLNHTGQVAFTGELSGGSRGIYLGDRNGVLTQIAREYAPIPETNSSFISVGPPTTNNAGQVVFKALTYNASAVHSVSRGIYIYDDNMGIVKIIGDDDTLLNSRVTSFSINTEQPLAQMPRGSFNSAGQLAINFRLADGRSGVAIATIVPEPNTLLLLTIASSTLLLRQSRHIRYHQKNDGPTCTQLIGPPVTFL